MFTFRFHQRSYSIFHFEWEWKWRQIHGPHFSSPQFMRCARGFGDWIEQYIGYTILYVPFVGLTDMGCASAKSMSIPVYQSWTSPTSDVFTARRYASAVYAVVCPSVCHKPALYQNGKNRTTPRDSFSDAENLSKIPTALPPTYGSAK